MRLASALLLVFTAAMILVHLTSTQLLRRAWAKETPGWLSVLNLFRFGTGTSWREPVTELTATSTWAKSADEGQPGPANQQCG